MRKISKLSLVAAVAVAGFSTANAQPLEQAIKDVEVSGSVVYRYDNYDDSKNFMDDTTKDRTESDKYKIGLNLSSKVNDYVKFNSRFIVGAKDTYDFASTNAKREETNSGDGSAEISLSQAYFGLTAIPNTVVNIGKQGLTTPYTVATDINGNEQSGTGVLALTSLKPVTLGAGYFNNQNIDAGIKGANSAPGLLGEVVRGVAGSIGLDGGEDLYVATAQGDLDFVKLESWYLGMQDTFNSYTLAATGNIDLASDAKIGLEARYVNLKLDNEIFDGDQRKNDMFRLAVDGKINIVNAKVAYTQTGKDGGLTAVDQDAKNTSLGWAITSNGIPDAKYWQAALGADILDNLNFTLNYGNLKTDLDGSVLDFKQQETYGQLTYKMSKNLSTYIRYGNFEEKINSEKSVDQDRGRIQVAYSF